MPLHLSGAVVLEPSRTRYQEFGTERMKDQSYCGSFLSRRTNPHVEGSGNMAVSHGTSAINQMFRKSYLVA